MKKTTLVIILCVVIIAVATIFLIFNHFDTLKNHAPAEVSLYIHTYPQVINKLDNRYKSTILSHAEALNLTPNQATQVLSYTKKELAIFKQPQQGYRLMTYTSQPLENYLRSQGISFITCEKIVIFPETNNLCTQPNLSEIASYQPKNFTFAQVTAYYSGKEALFLPDFIDKKYSEPIYAYLYKKSWLRDSAFTIKTTAKSDLATGNSASVWRLASLETSAPAYYGVNLNLKKLPFNASLEPENFTFRLAQQFDQVAEFLIADEKFAFIINNKNTQEIQQIIKQQLAYLVPQEQKKLLPDNSEAINLVANPNQWTFNQIDATRWELFEDQLNLTIYVEQIGNDIIVSSKPLASFQEKNGILPSNSCFTNHPSLFMMNSRRNTPDIGQIIFGIDETSQNIDICVD